jgi:hypothetical protein
MPITILVVITVIGDMRIDQRNAGAAVNSIGTGDTFIVDRFKYGTVAAVVFVYFTRKAKAEVTTIESDVKADVTKVETDIKKIVLAHGNA